jgi:hypothetical protein
MKNSAPKGKAMINEEVTNFASRMIARIGGQLESVTFYPHPFTGGGLVIVPGDGVGFIPDLISEIYECNPPPVMFYCMRKSELYQLSLMGVFGWPNPLEEKPHLAFWLKNKGVVLHGRDIRDEIKIPADMSGFLECHALRCKQFVRNWALDQLRRKNHRGMIKELERQARYLMATALLSKNEWDVSQEAIPERFDRSFKNERANQVWANMDALARRAEEMDEGDSRRSAFESLWLFDQFLLQIREYTL